MRTTSTLVGRFSAICRRRCACHEGVGTRTNFEFVDAPPSGGDLVDLAGIASSFAPNYAPEEIMEIANKLYNKAKNK